MATTVSKVRAVELLVISVKESDKKPGSGWKIRVVQWVNGEKSVSVKLECGEFWKDEASQETRFKAKGFTKRDLEACKPFWAQIMALMTNPPAVKPLDAAAAEDPEGPGF